jgi:hypothetical protein
MRLRIADAEAESAVGPQEARTQMVQSPNNRPKFKVDFGICVSTVNFNCVF